MSKGGRFLEQKAPEKGNAWVKVLVIVLAVILVIGALGAWFVVSKMNKIQKAQLAENQLSEEDLAGLLVEDPTQETEAVPTETTEPKPTDPDYGKMGKVINVLLIGQDAREGEESKNSDTVILITVNKETKKITMTSFLRDSYVTLNNVVDSNGKSHSGSTKLTLAYALGYQWGGTLGAMQVMDQVITNNFGPVVDHNIEVNMEAFDACINALGGVTITLDKDEAKYMNNYFSKFEAEGREFFEGDNLVDGWAAEVYVRTRHANNGDNDYNRTNRQRQVVAQVLEKVKNMSILELNKLVDQLLPLVSTDMSNADMTNYILEVLPILPEVTLESIQCPNKEMGLYGKIEDIFHNGEEHSVQHFDPAKCKAILVPITECD
ncbi:MAG: LCP family protein [Oscillospiraceae bacterium]|nr:LCP family protein [Oscillospiraceae bacterium]